MLKILSRFLFGFVVLALLAAALIVEASPRVPPVSPPQPEDVLAARAFVGQARAASRGERLESVTATEAELNSMALLGSRMLPGLRIRFHVGEGEVAGEASLPVPGTGRRLWLNGAASAAEFEGAFVFSRLRLGRIPLPPGMTMEAGRIAANLVAGDGVGDRLAGAATAMTIDGDRIHLDLALKEEGGAEIARNVFGAMRGAPLPNAEAIRRYAGLIGEALLSGELPERGGFLPHLRFTLEAALAGAPQEGAADAYAAAFIALAALCGARDFGLILGGVAGGLFEEEGAAKNRCRRVTLNGRIDSRRHFITAAAIQAASNRGFSVTLGEFKELRDTARAGGFDFTDIAANNSGIRLSDRMMAAPVAEWPALIAMIGNERDVIIDYEGVPQRLPAEEFAARFRDVDSPRYAEMMRRIEAKIDLLPLHRRD